LNQLKLPSSIYIDDNQTIYIADKMNNRIVKWKMNADQGEIVADNNMIVNDIYLYAPTGVAIDKTTDSMIICNAGYQNIIRWSLKNASDQEILYSNVDCWDITTDPNGYFYFFDARENTIIQRNIKTNRQKVFLKVYVNANMSSIYAAMSSLAVDKNNSIYITDNGHHRIVRWTANSIKGTVVAGGNGQGDSLSKMNRPVGLALDSSEDIYIADTDNHRIVCWAAGEKEGVLIVGGNGEGNASDQLSAPQHVAFDQYNNLYVVDTGNNRIQKFLLDFD